MSNPLFDDLYSLPKNYRFPRFSRYFTLIMSVLIIIYAIYMIFTKVNDDTSTFMKIIPFLIMFLSLDSLSRNLMSLNKVFIDEQMIKFSFLAKKSVSIPWLRMNKMELYKGKSRSFVIYYTENGIEKKFYLTMQFPKMIEIINLIAYLAPHVEFDEFIRSLAVLPKKQEN